MFGYFAIVLTHLILINVRALAMDRREIECETKKNMMLCAEAAERVYDT